ncbi:MAG: FhaA domain-containing protein [Jiangellaceae bacterium]
MGVLQRFERRLEGLVTGAFTKAFRAEVQPVEIAAALQRELDNNAQIVTRERSLVPNDFVIELGPSDHGRLAPYTATLAHELVDLVREHAELQHYAFTGPVTVAFEEHDDLGTGQFRVRSTVRAGVDRGATYAPTESTERSAAAYLVINGTQHPVVAPGLVLGRGSECDLRIDDPGVSRRHAEIRVTGSGPDAQIIVVDLGSTNGTVVDGVRAAQAPLSDGSRIVLGSTIVDVHRRTPRR